MRVPSPFTFCFSNVVSCIRNCAEWVPALLELGAAGVITLSVLWKGDKWRIEWSTQLHTFVEPFFPFSKMNCRFGVIKKVEQKARGGCTFISYSEWALQEEPVFLSSTPSDAEWSRGFPKLCSVASTDCSVGREDSRSSHVLWRVWSALECLWKNTVDLWSSSQWLLPRESSMMSESGGMEDVAFLRPACSPPINPGECSGL